MDEEHEVQDEEMEEMDDEEDMDTEELAETNDIHITTLVELLMDKGVFTQEEFKAKMDELYPDEPDDSEDEGDE